MPAAWLFEIRESLKQGWIVFLTVFVFNIVFTMTGMLFEPSLRSWVVCGETDPQHIVRRFSGSARCLDKRYVVQEAVRREGVLGAVEGVIGVLCVPILGAYSDMFGRVPILRTLILSKIVSLGCILTSNGSMLILTIASIAKGVTHGFFATFHSILGDLGGNRGVSFTIKIGAAHGGQLLGWCAALAIMRMEVLDYSLMWLVSIGLFALGTVAAVQIKETLPKKSLPNASPYSSLKLAVLEIQDFVRQEPFLIRWLAGKFVMVMGVSVVFLLRSFVLSTFDWRQGEFEAISGVLGGSLGFASTLGGPVLMRHWSTELVIKRCTLIAAVALNILIMAPYGAIFCLVPVLMIAASSCVIAASTTLIAERYTENQGKVQSMTVAATSTASTLGHFVHSCIYNAKAASFPGQAAPFSVAAILGWFGYVFIRDALALPLRPIQETNKVPDMSLNEVVGSETEERRPVGFHEHVDM